MKHILKRILLDQPLALQNLSSKTKSTKGYSIVKNKISKHFLARVYYFRKIDLNGCEASYHLRGRSYVTSVNKTTSVVTYPIHLMGEFICKIMSTITFEQTTYQVHSKEPNPTNFHKDKKKDYAESLIKNDDDFDTAFPM